MYERANLSSTSPGTFYADLTAMLAHVLEGERDPVSNLANASALLYDQLEHLNWAGFYLLKNEHLLVGPFQGKPACARISLSKGVCGTAAAQRNTIIVPDVHAFPGHIACDSASRSEIVVPLEFGGKLIGVLDLDSPIAARFDGEDKAGLEEAVRLFLEGSDPLAFVD